jgi:hypothetical protein
MRAIYALVFLAALLLPNHIIGQSSNNNRFAVFVHAGARLSDPKIKQITGALFERGYVVRAPDNDEDKVGGAGVDYFDNSAARAAQEIADLMNKMLKEVGLKTGNDQELKPRLQRVRAPPTYIRVWLFGRGTK